MIKPFKFLRGTNGDIVVSTPRGGYYDRTINPDLYGGVRLSELSDRVQQIMRSPEYIPAGYVQVPIPQTFYDGFVISRVRTKMRQNINWRGYEEAWIDERNEYVRLKILGGINIGGMMHITYEITTHHTTSQRYRVSVPLINLQRRG